MINNFEVIIGIEVHTVLNTKTKMFSSSLNLHNAVPNTLVNVIDLGLPGILPAPNAMAIVKAIWLAKSINAEINYQNIQFDRKNYYYLDLPKGYQITQQFFPIGKNGKINIMSNNIEKVITIQRMHLEEDTAKQIIKNGYIELDYNRCGLPLIEIVTDPVIYSANEAMEYLKKLVQILRFNNISDAKLEDGSLRADVNISVRPIGQKSLNNKVEIKNINSISNVGKAINFEINRQIGLYFQNKEVLQETRRFDDQTNQTILMRTKEDAINYRYFHEPNITKIQLTDNEYQQILKLKNKDINEIVIDLVNWGLSQANIDLLLNDYDLYKKYIQLLDLTNLPILAFNWLTVDLIGYLKKDNLQINDLDDLVLVELAKMLTKLNNQEINGKQAKIILEEIYKNKLTTIEIIKKYNFEQIKDEKIILNLVEKIISNNLEMVNQFSDRPERVIKFLVGMVMKETNAQANPKITTDIINKLLVNKFKK